MFFKDSTHSLSLTTEQEPGTDRVEELNGDELVQALQSQVERERRAARTVFDELMQARSTKQWGKAEDGIRSGARIGNSDRAGRREQQLVKEKDLHDADMRDR